MKTNYSVYQTLQIGQLPYENGRGMVKAWDLGGKLIEPNTLSQALQTARLPFIFKWVALMPDCHLGTGATVGSVIPVRGAICPASVGVDIGCGMQAIQTNLRITDITQNHEDIRGAIEKAIPNGRTEPIIHDKGSWDNPPEVVKTRFEVVPIQSLNNKTLSQVYEEIKSKNPRAVGRNVKHPVNHLGTLGTGNHFIELCVDKNDYIWIVVHSGSRGTGNAIGRYFTEVAKDLCKKWFIDLPNPDLAYLPISSEEARDYLFAMKWAQAYAKESRNIMTMITLDVLLNFKYDKYFELSYYKIDCHHNYIAWENHFNQNVLVIRKGAVNASKNTLGIIPGSMGAKSFIVRGLGNPDSFHSCSHGAGRLMSRGEARRILTLDDHLQDTQGVCCLKDESVLDESPKAYKNIDDVMEAQKDLVEPINTLKQFICVKGADKGKHK